MGANLSVFEPGLTGMTAAEWLVVGPGMLLVYAYLGYPAILWVIARVRRQTIPATDPIQWPEATILLPAFNEERAIGPTLDALLAVDYPAERRHILVISDASTDRTDEIVRAYAPRGVRLIRLAKRAGKTAAENAAAPHLSGTIVVNTDATIRIRRASLKALIRVFQDPGIGLASGRDVSVGNVSQEANRSESGYVGYEMWLRSLETRAGSIVGASGCFYAIRRSLFDPVFPAALSRDFAAALTSVGRGYRAVSVDDAVCLVPRTPSIRSEYRRKVRTMTRGLETLWFERNVLLRRRQRLFAFQLVSHKLVRWLVFLGAPVAVGGLVLLAFQEAWARWALAAAGLGLGLGATAFLWPTGQRPPRLIAVLGFLVGSLVAGLVAWTKALRAELNPVWEPTRRP